MNKPEVCGYCRWWRLTVSAVVTGANILALRQSRITPARNFGKKRMGLKDMTSMDNQVAKKDAGKPKLTLVPSKIIYDIAEVREYGNRKYPEGGTENWRQVDPQRYRDAAFRHFLKYLDDPASVDEESGLLHRKQAELEG